MATEERSFSTHELRDRQDHYAYRQALPLNATAAGNSGINSDGILLTGGCQNRIDIIARCYESISIADTKNLTVKIQTSTDNGVSDAYADAYEIYNVTASGAAITFVPGDQIGDRITFNTDSELYAKVVLITTDGAAAGSVNVYQDLIV